MGSCQAMTCDRGIDTSHPLGTLSAECRLDPQYASHTGYSTVDAKRSKNFRALQRQSRKAAGRKSVYKEFGNPLAGCFPVLLQMPVLFALFTPRGSPFSDINYTVNLQIFPKNKSNGFSPSVFNCSPEHLYC